MIEVERKFRPTEEQLAALLKDADFLGEKTLEDIYYDYPDYRLFKDEIHLRNRNGDFELKIGDDEGLGVSKEIEEEEEIKSFFKTSKSIEEFIKEDLIPIIIYTTRRKKYKKGEFNIDIDELDFGYKCVEIELLVGDESEVSEAKEKIKELAQKYDFKIEKIPAKRKEYFRVLKPEIFKQLYS